MREFPVWVPAGEERLCGVICAPDGDSADLGVLLLTGGNYTRTHRNRMWVRAARELAERRVASLRVDYHGVGDSTGRVVFHLDDPLVEDVMASADFFRRATRVSRLAIVATCFGGRGAVAASALRDDVVSTTVFPVPAEIPARADQRAPFRRRLRMWIKKSELGARLLRSPKVKRARAAVADRRGAPDLIVSPRFRRDTALSASKGTVRFVFGEHEKELPGLERMIDELRAELPPEELSRIELHVVPGRELARFQTFGDQDVVVEEAVASVLAALAEASP